MIDRESDRYLLVEVGWQNDRRIYISIIINKLWIQQDGTKEGIANDLIALGLGISKDQIVLGFKPIERRILTEFAAY